MEFDLQARIEKAARIAQESDVPKPSLLSSPLQRLSTMIMKPLRARTVHPDHVVIAAVDKTQPERQEHETRGMHCLSRVSDCHKNTGQMQQENTPEAELVEILTPGSPIMVDDDLESDLMLDDSVFEESRTADTPRRRSSSMEYQMDNNAIYEALTPPSGSSCHQCKSRRDPRRLVQCASPTPLRAPNCLRRPCRKKYCG